ncbi:MAG TPA: hypothetical protein VHS31_13235 [Tepidisphaeraceae bacterium]|jgi:predicted alpha/beta hydrolase family esterase|nr:hypothetical protein [Tepidisphaeraceae bacterium]
MSQGKTAVIIIHGVGEQRAMGTVNRFTRLLAGTFVRSKPDSESKLFDLRRLSTLSKDPSNPYDPPKAEEAKIKVHGYPPDTVFYELYWAFHYRDTKPAMVIRWALTVLFKLFSTGQARHLGRKVSSVGMAYLLVTLVFVASIFLAARGVSQLLHPNQNVWLGTLHLIAAVLLPCFFAAFKPFLVGWAGDAARYFGKSPDNPIERQQIREEGIALLRRLHAPNKYGKSEYDSIVVVGHSLGSVIAYDIVLNYWNEINRDIEIAGDDESLNSALHAIEALVGDLAPADDTSWNAPATASIAEEYQCRQTEFVNLLRASSRVNAKGRNVRLIITHILLASQRVGCRK